MDLPRALTALNTRSFIEGFSDATTAAQGQLLLEASTALPVPVLHGGTEIRAVEVLRQLAHATRLDYEDSVYDVYRQWALARYVGVFDLVPRHYSGQPRLSLSGPGCRVVGNQRAVLSEDLGIGFASALSRTWARRRWPGYPLQLIDVDIAVDIGLISSGRARRTDYLVASYDAGVARPVLLGLLECKGSESRAYALRQVSSGAKQIEDTELGGRRVPGLVCSLHSGRDAVRYFAIEVEPLGSAGSLVLPEVPGLEELFRVPWARLADIADEKELYERLAPNRLKVKRPSSDARARIKDERVIQDRLYRGTSTRVPLPGGQLLYFLGVEASLLAAMQRPDGLEAYRVQADLLPALQQADGFVNAERVEAAAEDGVGLLLEIV